MSKVPMTMAFSRSARLRPLLDGEVEIEGVDLIPCVISPGDLFWRQLRHQEFDLSELSLASLLVLKDAGIAPYSAIPAFPSRAFFHVNTIVHEDSGIESPEDLRGKRVGVAEYQQTAAVWARGAFEHEFGVRPSEIEWYMGRSARRSHAKSTGFRPPDDVTLHTLSEGKTLGAMLLDREIDAIVAYSPRHGGLGLGQEDDEHAGQRADSYVDKDDLDPMSSPTVRWLFPDARAEGFRYHQSTGIFPFNHIVALRDSLIEQYPWLARNVFDAFERARALATRRLSMQLEPYEVLGAVNIETVLDVDRKMAYGVTANLPTINAALQYSSEQGLIGSQLTHEDVFAPSVNAL